MHLNGTPEADGGVATGGDVQVSPVTSSPDRCMVVEWLRSHGSTVATIHCFGKNGNLVNSEFAIQFVAAVPIA